MKSYNELEALIVDCGVHAQLGPVGKGYGIEQNPHELATFLVRMQGLGVQSVLEIGTGYKAGLARFLAQEMGWQVTTVDIKDYGHSFAGIEFITEKPIYWQYDLSGNKFTKNYRIWDLLFIDAAHDYASVKHDYEFYKQHATKAIAFHDIAGLRDCEGARYFWDEIHKKSEEMYHYKGGKVVTLNHKIYKAYEVIADSDQRAGIGWIEL